MPQQVRLGHVLARYADATTRNKATITKAYHLIQRSDGLAGTNKTYHKTVAGSADQPNKTQLLQTRVYDVARGLVRDMGELIDTTATKDFANKVTSADVVLDGDVLIENAPPTFLLSLEKQLIDLRTFFSTMPVLPADEEWAYNAAQKCQVSRPSKSTRVELVKEGLVLHPPTDKFPAQTQLVEVSKTVGEWTTTKFSGAVKLEDKDALVERTTKLLDAVKRALHEANAYVTEDLHPSHDLLRFVTEGIL